MLWRYFGLRLNLMNTLGCADCKLSSSDIRASPRVLPRLHSQRLCPI